MLGVVSYNKANSQTENFLSQYTSSVLISIITNIYIWGTANCDSSDKPRQIQTKNEIKLTPNQWNNLAMDSSKFKCFKIRFLSNETKISSKPIQKDVIAMK